MKTKSLILLPLALFISCGKNSDDSSASKSSESNPLSGTLSGKNDDTSNAVVRRVFDIHSLGELDNFEIKSQYISSLNKRIIEFKLANGQEIQDQCYDLSGEARLSTKVNSRRIVQLMVELPQNKVTPTIVNCPFFENNQLEIKNFRLLPDLHLTDEKKGHHYLRDVHNYSFEHIVFEKSNSYIMNDKITLNAKKMVFYYSNISTFPADENKAQNENDGLSGGELTLNTQEVVGLVNFRLKGQDGGDITRRPPGKPAMPEDPSLNGVCDKKGRCDGKPGSQGYKGEKGYPGRNGGDSGSLVLKFNKSLGLDLVFDARPGQGSIGGQGGEGGEGQPGGYPGKMDRTDPLGPCRPLCVRIPYEAMRGRAATGPRGAEGDRGDQGQSGAIIPSKIIHKNETILLDRFAKLNFEVDYE